MPSCCSGDGKILSRWHELPVGNFADCIECDRHGGAHTLMPFRRRSSSPDMLVTPIDPPTERELTSLRALRSSYRLSSIGFARMSQGAVSLLANHSSRLVEDLQSSCGG